MTICEVSFCGLAKGLFLVLLFSPVLASSACDEEQAQVNGLGDLLPDNGGSGDDLQQNDNVDSEGIVQGGDSEGDLTGEGADSSDGADIFDAEQLVINLQYDGDIEFSDIIVYLFTQTEGQPACSTMDPEQPPFPASKSAGIGSLTQPVQFFFPNLSLETPTLRFTALVVAHEGGVGNVVAWGCEDSEIVVEIANSTVVTMVLQDVQP